MAKLRVSIIDEVRNRRLKVDLPDDAAMEKLLPALAKKLVEHGADIVDLNIGRRKKDGPEVMRWMIDIMQKVIPGVSLSLDTTNAAAIRAGLERCQELGYEFYYPKQRRKAYV